MMFKLGVRKKQAAEVAGSVSGVDDRKFIGVEEKAHLRRRGGAMRLAGNLLIITGVLMLVGIGGWLGYREWDNQQYLQQVQQEFGSGKFEPNMADLPTPAPTPPPPPPQLND